MTAPVPEENDQPIATEGMDERPHEHASELPDEADRTTPTGEQEENAETSMDEPSVAPGSE